VNFYLLDSKVFKPGYKPAALLPRMSILGCDYARIYIETLSNFQGSLILCSYIYTVHFQSTYQWIYYFIIGDTIQVMTIHLASQIPSMHAVMAFISKDLEASQ